MKRAIVLIMIGAVLGGGVVWLLKHGDRPEAEHAEKAEEEKGKPNLTHNAGGEVVIGMSRETQGDAGIMVTNPMPVQLAPEIKAFGRVLDPAPLGKLLTDLLTAELAFDNSHQELERMKVLRAQTNASERAFQTAEAAYLRDQLTAGGIRLQIQTTWGTKMAELLGPAIVPPGTTRNRDSLPFQLVSSERAMVRLDLPAETLSAPPGRARLVPLAEGVVLAADFFDFAPNMEPLTQGQGLLFLVPENQARLSPGAAVTGYIEAGGAALAGVIVPRDAVVRAQGKGWIYVRDEDGASFTRKEVPLDHAVENGWFVTRGVTATNDVVVIGAQMLLSEELKASIGGD